MKKKKSTLSIKHIASLWFLLAFGLFGALLLREDDAFVLDTDIISLLPELATPANLEEPIAKAQRKFQQKLIFVLDMPTDKEAKQAVNLLQQELGILEKSGHLKIIPYETSAQKIIAFYQPLQFSFLSEKRQDLLQKNKLEDLEGDIISSYTNPARLVSSQMISQDPLGLFASLLEEKFKLPSGAYFKDGLLLFQHENRRQTFVLSQLQKTPFALDVQGVLMSKINEITNKIESQHRGSKLHTIGFLMHAYQNAQSARNEVALFGSISIISIFILFIVFFMSLKPLVLMILSILTGCLVGVTACLVFFGSIHLLTLVFGTSLVGVSVDYVLHYFCKGLDRKGSFLPQEALLHAFPAITMGLITSVIAFAFLLLSPFPGIQQMAVFSIAGLISVYFCVVGFYPTLTRDIQFPPRERIFALSQRYNAFWQGLSSKTRGALVLSLVAIASVGVWKINVEDDIRALYRPPPELLKVETWAQNVGQEKISSQFFIVEGKNAEELLLQQEQLTLTLRQLEEEKHLGSHLALNHFIPSLAKQKTNYDLLERTLFQRGNILDSVAEQVGLPQQIVREYRANFITSKEKFVSFNDWLAHPASTSYRHLWLGTKEGRALGLVQLNEVRDVAALHAVAEKQEGVYFIDHVSLYRSLFEKYRKQIMLLTAIAYLFVWLLLSVRYGFIRGVMTILPPVLAATLTVGILGFLGISFTLFHMMALLLVLGIGVDYSIFFYEAGKAKTATMIIIALAASTTLLAFGLLAFSQTEAIRAFGIVIFTGIMLVFILTPLGEYKKT